MAPGNQSDVLWQIQSRQERSYSGGEGWERAGPMSAPSQSIVDPKWIQSLAKAGPESCQGQPKVIISQRDFEIEQIWPRVGSKSALE